MFSFTLSEILAELKNRFSSYLLRLLSNSEERLGAETARPCHLQLSFPLFPWAHIKCLEDLLKTSLLCSTQPYKGNSKGKATK